MAENRENMIDVQGVTKIYRLYDKPIDRLKESLSIRHKNYHRDFYALNLVSFSVARGESVGIIGTNGSGKSTMLKIITGVLTQTAGTVSVRGKVCALLELGAGFNMDYTGIENIYMNGTMMGFSKEEMDAKLQEILDFADIGDFVYQPVKSYSSGMFVRLAFALNIAVDPEVLIVDEALSVGDVFFQAKCYHRMDELKKKGTTILMVTHDMGSVMKYCDKVVLLNKGEKVAEGAPGDMVDLYKKILAGQFDGNVDDVIAGQDFGVETVGSAGLGAAGKTTGADENTAQSANGTSAKAGNDAARGSTANDMSGGAAGSSNAGTDGAAANDANTTNSDTEGAKQHNAGGQPSGAGAAQASSAGGDAASAHTPQHLMKSQMQLNPQVQAYGNGKAEIYDLGIVDERGKLTNVILKGERFSIRERIRFNDTIESPIFTFTIKDKRGNDLTGTNTMFEGREIPAVHKGDSYDCAFTQKMTLQGGEYLLSMSCTGFEQGVHTVYHRLYDVASLTVISNKNTVGVYDMESDVSLVRHDAKD